MQIDDLLKFMVDQQASDLHLKPMRPPLVRMNGKLLPLKADAIKPDRLDEMIDTILNDRLRAHLEKDLACDFGYSVAGVSRFRASVFHQRGTLSAVFRRVPFDFPSLEDWGMPPVLSTLSQLPAGLVLITGPTGSGKSSTLAAVMREIADTRLAHLVTVEDPIEFLLSDNLASVTQREVGLDTPTFSAALRNVLRQDPDVIMVGEMRDATTMQTVLTAAETGHLVFSTLHTNNAVQTVDRILDQFSERNHRQIRQQLSQVLQAIISMRLVERADGSGLVAAVEILRRTPRVAKLVLDGNLESLQEEIEKSVTYEHMQTMNQSLAALVLNNVVDREVALRSSDNPGDLDLLLRKFLYAAEHGEEATGGEMAEPLSDYSKIVELQEIKRLYDEQDENHRGALAEKDEQIQHLRTELDQLNSSGQDSEAEQARAEAERLGRQLEVMRKDYEAKIERLNTRIRELTSGTAAPSPPPAPDSGGRKGFFRR